jgi:hypothetical protein
MSKYLVETISVFRIRYVVEAESAERAKTEVDMQDADEFGQLHIGENIIGCREISDEQLAPLFYEDNPHLERWGPAKAMEYVYVVEYKD